MPNPQPQSSLSTLSRRAFLKWSAAGATLTASTSFLEGCASQPTAIRPEGQATLPSDQATVFEALAPVILDRDAVETRGISQAIDAGIGSFGPINEAQFGELLGLLTLSPTRALVGGLWSDWPNADKEDLSDFLNGWRNSSLGLLNAGYGALVKITASVYYGDARHFGDSGYPGPPAHALQGLPQFQKETAA
ncbi:MAG: hypothetical protein IPM37_14325 [Hahellaceae bacterium]|nr:hypothetical protein [Hahellaceae bacterium]